VLVYKATDAVNFAQGEFVMIAGFIAVGALTVLGAPLWLSIIAALIGMVGFGFALERVMLRKLIGRPVIAVVMATIGLAAILRGVGPFGIFQGPRPLPLPLPDEPLLGRFRSTLVRDGFFEEDGELWTPDGTLVAQSRQLGLLLGAPA